MATIFDEPVRLLAQWGLFDVILPFILIFSIVYGILDRVKIFEGTSDPNKVHQMLAFTISFIAIASPQIVGATTAVAVIGTMTMVVLVTLAVVMGLVHGDTEPKSGFWAVIIFVGLAAILYFIEVLGIARINTIFDVIIPIILILGVFWTITHYITGGEFSLPESKPKKPEAKAKEEGKEAKDEKKEASKPAQKGEAPKWEELPKEVVQTGSTRF